VFPLSIGEFCVVVPLPNLGFISFLVRTVGEFVGHLDFADGLQPLQVLYREPAPLDFLVPLGRNFADQPQDLVCGGHDLAVGVLQQLHDLLHDLGLRQDDLAGGLVEQQTVDREQELVDHFVVLLLFVDENDDLLDDHAFGEDGTHFVVFGEILDDHDALQGDVVVAEAGLHLLLQELDQVGLSVDLFPLPAFALGHDAEEFDALVCVCVRIEGHLHQRGQIFVDDGLHVFVSDFGDDVFDCLHQQGVTVFECPFENGSESVLHCEHLAVLLQVREIHHECHQFGRDCGFRELDDQHVEDGQTLSQGQGCADFVAFTQLLQDRDPDGSLGRHLQQLNDFEQKTVPSHLVTEFQIETEVHDESQGQSHDLAVGVGQEPVEFLDDLECHHGPFVLTEDAEFLQETQALVQQVLVVFVQIVDQQVDYFAFDHLFFDDQVFSQVEQQAETHRQQFFGALGHFDECDAVLLHVLGRDCAVFTQFRVSLVNLLFAEFVLLYVEFDYFDGGVADLVLRYELVEHCVGRQDLEDGHDVVGDVHGALLLFPQHARDYV